MLVDALPRFFDNFQSNMFTGGPSQPKHFFGGSLRGMFYTSYYVLIIFV